MYRRKRTIAAIITTIKKDTIMMKCIPSFDKFKVIIYLLDQGDITPEKEKFYNKLKRKGHHIYCIKQDFGLSGARNFLIEKVIEPYILIADDDVELTTNPYNVLYQFKKANNIGIIGGQLYNVDKQREHNYHYALKIENKTLFMYKSNNIDIVLNFFIAKKELFNDIRWDEKLKLVEHLDFFLTLKQLNKWKVIFDPKLYGKHYSYSLRPLEYIAIRKNNVQTYRKMVMKKWEILNTKRLDDINQLEDGMKNDFKVIIETAKEMNLPIFLHGGTLLTVIRDKVFTMYEDFDFGIFLCDFNEPIKQEFIKKLINKSFVLREEKKQAAWVSKLWTATGYGVDFFVFNETKNSYYHRSYGGYHQFPKECLDTLDTINVFNIEANIPHNPKIFLGALYGKTWQTPNPNFKKPQDFYCWTKTPIIESNYFTSMLPITNSYLLNQSFDSIINLIDLINNNNIFFWLEKDILINIITNNNFSYEKIQLGVKTKLDADKIYSLANQLKINVEIRINNKQDTKIKKIKDRIINVPKPLVKYIEKFTKKSWEEFTKEYNIR